MVTALISAVILLSTYLWFRSSSKKYLPLPPGPKGWPFIGNILDRPMVEEWKVYLEWSKKYDSDIVATKLGEQHIIILNTTETTSDLLDKRSGIYSDRPTMVSLELCGLTDWDLGSLRYGPFWRSCRRIAHQSFNSGVIGQYRFQQNKAISRFLQSLLEHPDTFSHHIKHMTAQMIVSITYGLDVSPLDDPFIALADTQLAVTHLCFDTMPGWWVDVFSILRYVPSWVPGANFQKILNHFKEKGQELINTPFAETKKQMKSNTHIPCAVSYSLEQYENKSNIDKDTMAVEYQKSLQAMSASLYTGSDTTTSALLSVIYGLLSSSHILPQAQAQIDGLLKGIRLPTLEDKNELTWISAIVMETLRWGIILPLGVSHYVDVEDEYKGFRIPAGSIVLSNIWAILNNPKTYPDPHLFKPERFLNKDGTLRKDIKDPSSAVFGFGRRICPGRFLLESSLWLTVACMIASFDITKKKDSKGAIIEPSWKYIEGIICFPESFECSIIPRGDEARKLIIETNKI